MKQVHILSPGFSTPNGRAFLSPIVRHLDEIAERGIAVRFFTQDRPAVVDCDVLLVDSKFLRNDWVGDGPGPLPRLRRYRQAIGRVLWFDTTDSTGTLRAEVLSAVDGYYKNQLLTDRSMYTEPMYGGRPYTEYYHEQFGVIDDDVRHSTKVESSQLDKLAISWNSGLADHSLYAPVYAKLRSLIPRRVDRHLPWRWLLRSPLRWTSPGVPREREITSRFGTGHERATVRFQRERIIELLGDRLESEKIDRRREYWDELEDSKLMLSPFGWGEITLRDFEAFQTGCVILKPSLGHMETWPPYFEAGETMLTFKWDFSDLSETIEGALENYSESRQLAEEAQRRYRRYLLGDSAAIAFADRFESIVRG